jgi:hypothetical protein
MEIKIKGNKESFQQHHRIDYLDIKLSGTFSFAENSTIFLGYSNHHLTFNNRQDFYRFSEKIKGASLEQIVLLSQDFNLSPLFIESLREKGDIEIGLFKSIFLIYNWIEIALTDAYAVNLGDKIYNEFIIDYSGKLEVQKEIYFINTKYLDSNYLPSIQRLLDLNLLASASFETNVGNYQTYFIPLIKPGVSREFFNTEFDKNGSKTYGLWKDILNDRDSRIKYWITYRS